VPDKIGYAMPEISVSAFETKELRQLRADEPQSYPGLKPYEDRLRNELHDGARANRPRQKCDGGGEQSSAGGKGSEA
jgi:hypothetical protein